MEATRKGHESTIRTRTPPHESTVKNVVGVHESIVTTWLSMDPNKALRKHYGSVTAADGSHMGAEHGSTMYRQKYLTYLVMEAPREVHGNKKANP